MRRSILVLVFALGCDAEDEWFPETTYVMDTIEGRGWYRGLRIRVRDDHRLEVDAGCNPLFGPYRLRGDELVAQHLGRNDLGCSPSQLHEQDDWMGQFLHNAPTYELDGPELILADEFVTIVLVDEAIEDPDRPLVGPTWWIQATFAEGSVEVWDYRNTGTMKLGADGRVAIEGPCAWGTAVYVTDGELLTFAEIAIDPSQCEDHDPAGFVDEYVRELLAAGPLTYAIDSAQLTIGNGELGLVLRTK